MKQTDIYQQLQASDLPEQTFPAVMRWAEEDDHHLLCPADTLYPLLLKEIPDPPPVLFARGDVSLLAVPQLAIVGARRATPLGLENAEAFACSLAQAGLCITSGLAQGVDAASHRGALKAGGKTIAVMGTGISRIYPAVHRQLAKDILANGGLLLSEFPIDAGPASWHFPQRNRIISGLSLGVLIVEAALKSGSLITARMALEQGREVFAIPGSIHNPLARGCHQLIRQGAKLVETAADVIEELGSLHASLVLKASQPLSSREPSQPDMGGQLCFDPSDLSSKDCQLLEQIDYAPTPLDVIVLRSGLTIGELSSILLSLELKGLVRSVAGGYTRIEQLS